jgi:pimeloyl-ACP methyl ester carboxylesterase
VVDAQDGPTILVGHSYGGAVVTEAGNDDKVAGLVYVAAFQPDTGESPLDLAKKMPAATKAIKATPDGHLYIDQASFHEDFAADVPAAEANFMAVSQVTPAAQSFGVPITHAAWRTKPSWAVVATADRAINPDLERFMTQRAGSKTIELNSSHVAYISHPAQVAKLIEQAATQSGKE